MVIGGVIVTLEEAQDGHVTQGLGGEVKIGDRKVLSFVVDRAQMLHETVSEPPLCFTDVKAAASGAADRVDRVGWPKQHPPIDTLIHLTELVLTLSNFSFNASHFVQTKGVAMGTRMGPSYAYLFVGYVEQSLFCYYTGTIPHLFLRYIDDCVGSASCCHKELK
eukprot:g33190.t1